MAGTSAAVAATGAANAAIIAARNSELKSECLSLTMPKYQHDGSTIDQMRDYASCVYRVYGSGEPMSSTLALLIKASIVCAIIFGSAFGWREWRCGYFKGKLSDAALSSIIGIMVGGVIPFAIAVVVIAVKFLFS